MLKTKVWYDYQIEENKTGTIKNIRLSVVHGEDILQEAVEYLQGYLFCEYAKKLSIDLSIKYPKLQKNFINKTTDSIQQRIRDAQTLDNIRDITIPEYVVYDHYAIVGLKRIANCEGCIYTSPRQKDHIECPNGCLHMKEECEFCREIF